MYKMEILDMKKKWICKMYKIKLIIDLDSTPDL